MLRGPLGPSSQHEFFIPPQNCGVSSEIVNPLEEQCNPQDGQASHKATQLFEKDVPSLSLWYKALGNLSLLCLRCQIIFQVPISLNHDAYKSYNPNRSAIEFPELVIQPLLQKGQCTAGLVEFGINF